MLKTKYSSTVLIQNGKIRRSVANGIEFANDQQRRHIDLVKPLMNAWLRPKITGDESAEVLVRVKCLETTDGLTVEFKLQSASTVG